MVAVVFGRQQPLFIIFVELSLFYVLKQFNVIVLPQNIQYVVVCLPDALVWRLYQQQEPHQDLSFLQDILDAQSVGYEHVDAEQQLNGEFWVFDLFDEQNQDGFEDFTAQDSC